MNPAAVVVRLSVVCWPTGLAQDSWPIHRTHSGSNMEPFLSRRLQTCRWRPSSFRKSASPPRFPGFHFYASTGEKKYDVTKRYTTIVNVLSFCICFIYYIKTQCMGGLLLADYMISIENSAIRRHVGWRWRGHRLRFRRHRYRHRVCFTYLMVK